MIVLVTGGIKSGKSDFVLKLVRNNKNVYYIATATAEDNEMKEKILIHRRKRDKKIITLEEPIHITEKIRHLSPRAVLIIDCVNLWVANMMRHYNENEILTKVKKFCRCVKKFSKVFIVTNEVGLSLVSTNKLARKFQEILGKVNQIIANNADKVYFMLSGIPLRIK